MTTALAPNQLAAIAAACRQHHVSRLHAFGSVLRPDYRPGSGAGGSCATAASAAPSPLIDPTALGADPTGKTDSTAAFMRALELMAGKTLAPFAALSDHDASKEEGHVLGATLASLQA